MRPNTSNYTPKILTAVNCETQGGDLLLLLNLRRLAAARIMYQHPRITCDMSAFQCNNFDYNLSVSPSRPGISVGNECDIDVKRKGRGAKHCEATSALADDSSQLVALKNYER